MRNNLTVALRPIVLVSSGFNPRTYLPSKIASIPRWYERKAFLKAQKWPLITAVRKIRKKDGEAESENGADATAPVREMQGIT
jgi:hypothetical protein